MQPAEPIPFGRYVLRERLAQGGMGEVFRAVAIGEHGFEKPVVVKRVLPAHAGREELSEMFVAEAKLMTRLAHPNIVEVLDFGRGEHRDYYLVLELVDGVDLGRLLRAFAARGEPFPIALALFVAAQALRGLHHAHTRLADEGIAIVHRDVSPGNVLLSTEGEVKVADFGIALSQRGGGEGAGVAGKPGYMAPEQFEGRAVDPRADVFSVGVVLHQMIAGSLPFVGASVEDQQAAARQGDRSPLQVARPDAGEGIEAIVARALAADPEARFASARAMAQAVEGLRDAGQPMATADDLAEAVRAAKRELPAQAQRVIQLGSAASSREAPQELTRTGGAAGVGAFTLRFPVRADATTRHEDRGEAPIESSRTFDRYAAPEPRTERIAAEVMIAADVMIAAEAPGVAPTTMEAPIVGTSGMDADDDLRPAGVPDAHGGRALRVGIGAVVMVGAAAVWWGIATRAPGGRDRPEGTASATASAPSPLPEPVAITTATASVSALPPALPTTVRTASPRVAPIATTIVSAAPMVTAAATASAAPSDDDCKGTVWFRSEGSFAITGGPSPAQTPAKVVWRCGTYGVTARYRGEPADTQSVTVRVRAGGTTEVTLKPR